MSPDWSAQAEPVPYAELDDPQSLNLYAYVMNNPMRQIDLDGHFDCSGANASGIGCQTQAAWQAINNGQATSVEDYMQQQAVHQQSGLSESGSSQGGGFWHHVGNLLHGHSWNYAEVNVVQGEGEVREPNEAVTAGTDIAGIVGLASETAGRVMGPATALVSVLNNPSPKNKVTNLVLLIPGFEGMAVPAALGDFMDYSINHSSSGPAKIYGNEELGPELSTQSGACDAAGLPSC